MNPLLLILGRGITDSHSCYRPSRRRHLQRAAAMALAHDDHATARAIYDHLVTLPASGAGDQLMHAALMLHNGEAAEAAFVLQQILAEAVQVPADSGALPDNSCDSVEEALNQVQRELNNGLYVRALERLQRIIGRVETLIAAQALQAAAQDDVELITPLATLVELGDILLRLEARGRLAATLAEGLRKRELRADLALWATGGEQVNTLLIGQRATLLAAAAAKPNQAQIHYRLGVMCRTMGDRDGAIAAFRQVLAISPHHLPAAARLAVCLLHAGHVDDGMRLLKLSAKVPAPVLRRYYDLALAASDQDRFAQAVTLMTRDQPATEAADARANIAFALSEMALMDETRASFMQPATA